MKILYEEKLNAEYTKKKKMCFMVVCVMCSGIELKRM